MLTAFIFFMVSTRHKKSRSARLTDNRPSSVHNSKSKRTSLLHSMWLCLVLWPVLSGKSLLIPTACVQQCFDTHSLTHTFVKMAARMVEGTGNGNGNGRIVLPTECSGQSQIYTQKLWYGIGNWDFFLCFIFFAFFSRTSTRNAPCLNLRLPK